MSLAGVPLTLTALDFELRVTLMRRPSHVFRCDELIDQVWRRDFAGVDRVVDVHVSNLRQKLETDPPTRGGCAPSEASVTGSLLKGKPHDPN